MQRLVILPLALLGLAVAAGEGRSQEAADTLADELKLKNAHLSTDGPSVVAFLSTRAKGEADQKSLEKLIEQLSSADAATRQKAGAALVAIGTPAIPLVRAASRDIDAPEAASIAKGLLKTLEEDSATLTMSAIRILAGRKPVGTAEALLAYLPHVENDAVAEELKTALAAVAYLPGGKADPAMLAALTDDQPIRRAHAIMALCEGGNIYPLTDRLRKLLSDSKASVRLRAALALGRASDAKAVSTLITLLPELPLDQAKEVESALLDLAGDLAPKAPIGPDALSREKALDQWAKWWLDTEGPSLLGELTKRTLKEGDTTKALDLIEQLGDDAFNVRQDAEESLIKMGSNILPLLRQAAANNKDLEVKNRAAKCLTKIEATKLPPLSAVTCKMIALRRPKGAAEALLGFVPFIDDDGMGEDVQSALNAVAFLKTGKADPAVLKALDEKLPARRAAAVTALTSGPVEEYLPQLRKLLKDKDESVRVKTALGLATAKQTEAVPALVELVSTTTGDSASSIEDYLGRLAGPTAPKDLPAGDDNRKKRSEMWGKWWDDNKAKVVMIDMKEGPARERFLNHLVLVMPNNQCVVEWDKDKKEIWRIGGLNNPWDAQVLPGKRVLIAEQQGRRVTERNLKGEILWQKEWPAFYPTSAERLKNGHTFVACTNALIQVDRGGREVLRIDRPQHDVRSARRLPNGDIIVITTANQMQKLDTKGTVLKSAALGNVFYNQNEILNNGNVLIPLGWQNAVVEYDINGKEKSRTTVQTPMHATKLPNGNMLVVSQNFPYRILEIDKAGKQVADIQTNNQYVFRARKR